MATKFDIPITATDKTAQGIKSVNKNFQSLTKPIDRLEAATSKFSKGSAASDLIGKFGMIRKVVADATGGMAEAAEGIGILGGAAGATVAGVGILGVALAVATDKAIRFAAPIAAAGWELSRTSKLIDINAQALQIWRGAAQLNGVSQEAMTDSLNNLGNTLNDARWGRNNEALMLLHRLGIQIPYTAKGTVDAARAMVLLSDAMARQDPQTRQTVAGIFGVSGALPLISKGAKAVKADMDAYAKSGAMMTQKQIDASEGYSKQLVKLGNQWQHLKNDFAENVIIPWTGPFLDWLTKAVGLVDRLVAGKDLLGPGSNPAPHAAGHWPAGTGALKGAGAAAEAFFRAHGWSPNQAKGMGAGVTAEGGGLGLAGNGAFGIGQWRGARQRELLRRYGPNPTLDQQLAFMQWELTAARDKKTGLGEAEAGKQIGYATAAGPAAAAYIDAYMRPGAGAAGDYRRAALALQGGAPMAAQAKVEAAQAAPAAPSPSAEAPPTPGTVYTLPSDAAAAGGAKGSVKVDITLRNAPPGSVAKTSYSGDVHATTGIEHSMSSQI